MPRMYVKSNRSEYFYDDLKMGDAFAGVEKMLQETFLTRLLFGKQKTLTNSRNSKYDAGQESRPGTPESCDICEWEEPKFETFKNRVDSRCDGGRRVFQRRLPSGA